MQEMRITKGRGQALVELLEAIVAAAVVYYVLQPDALESHLNFFKRKRDQFVYWINVQDTLMGIRSLPETRNKSNT